MSVIKFQTAELKKRLALLGAVVKKSPIAIQQYIRVFATKTEAGVFVGATAVSSDAQITLYFEPKDTEVDASAPVDVLLPFDKLNRIVGNVPEVIANITLDISADNKQAKIKIGKSYSAIMRVAEMTKEWPEPMEQPENITAEFNLSALQWLIDRMSFVVPKSAGGTKFVVPISKMESDGSAVRLISTDGKRLAVAETSAERIAAEFTLETTEGDKVVSKKEKAKLATFELQLPLTALELLGSLETSGNITIQAGPTGFYMSTVREVLMVNKYHGEFPPYQSVIPKGGFATKALVNKDQLLLAVQLAIPNADSKLAQGVFEAGEGIPLSVKAAHNETTSADGGMFRNMSSDEVDTSASSGPKVDFSLDLNMLMPFLERAVATVTISANDPNKVVQFEDDGAAGRYLFLQMPTAPGSREV